MTANNKPPPGHKRVRDWVGMTVETTRDIANGWGTIPAGTRCVVTYAYAGLSLRCDPCECCGAQMTIKSVSSSAVRPIA